MDLLFLFAAIVGCVVARPSSENVTPVKVTIYYEALCPDCQIFFPAQLLPTYTDTTYDYASLISDLELVPYGWVEVEDVSQHKYHCQHGQAECDGNRLHGCANEYVTDKLALLKYIGCLEHLTLYGFKNKPYPVDKCQETLPEGLYQKIISCYNSNESWEIFEKNHKKTQAFFPYGGSVPYISFNDEKDDNLAQDATYDFKGILRKVAGVDN